MRKTIYLLYLYVVLVACNNEGYNQFTTMPPELDSLLTNYAAKYPNNKIYNLIFENRCNKQFFTLQCSSDCYDSNFMDGCFMKEGKIFIFWSINKSWRDSLLHIPQSELCFDSLAQYTDLSKTDIDYDAPYNPQTYRILSVNKYRKATILDWSYPKPASDTNVIHSSALNSIVNEYINENNSPNIVYLRFNNFDGTNYVSIGQDYVYNPETFTGMFYRDKRIVVTYSIDAIKNIDIIDKGSLFPVQTINDYRSLKRKYSMGEKKYRIVSKEIIEFIPFDNSIWMDI